MYFSIRASYRGEQAYLRGLDPISEWDGGTDLHLEITQFLASLWQS
jgi:hypothetical protein